MPLIKKKHWLEILLHLLFWTAVFYVVNSLTSLSFRMRMNHNGTIIERSEVRSLFPLSVLTLSFLMLLFYLNCFWLFKKVLHYKDQFRRIGIIAAWFAFVFFANFFIISFLLDFSNSTLINNYSLGIGDLNINSWRHMQLVILLIFLFVLGLSLAYFFSKEWIRNEFIRQQLEAYQLSTEIKFLKSQINPHFLFNTLNNLFSMAQGKGNEELADGISRLSAMMRYMLYESNTEQVSLRKEIEYIENYILLNKLRYADDEVRVNFNYPEYIDGLSIAPMLFIPFVENAFKYGVLIGQPWQIDMTVSLYDKQVVFRCDNKNYSFIKKMDDNTNGIGLENVKRRLELLYPDKYELMINSDGDKYIVELKIDLE